MAAINGYIDRRSEEKKASGKVWEEAGGGLYTGENGVLLQTVQIYTLHYILRGNCGRGREERQGRDAGKRGREERRKREEKKRRRREERQGRELERRGREERQGGEGGRRSRGEAGRAGRKERHGGEKH